MSKKKDTTSSHEGICYKIHTRGGEVVLAACDTELINGKWKDGRLRLSAPSGFYSDLSCDDPKVLSGLMEGCTQANLIGHRVIDHFIREGFIKEKAVMKVDGVPHALFVRMS